MKIKTREKSDVGIRVTLLSRPWHGNAAHRTMFVLLHVYTFLVNRKYTASGDWPRSSITNRVEKSCSPTNLEPSNPLACSHDQFKARSWRTRAALTAPTFPALTALLLLFARSLRSSPSLYVFLFILRHPKHPIRTRVIIVETVRRTQIITIVIVRVKTTISFVLSWRTGSVKFVILNSIYRRAMCTSGDHARIHFLLVILRFTFTASLLSVDPLNIEATGAHTLRQIHRWFTKLAISVASRKRAPPLT